MCRGQEEGDWSRPSRNSHKKELLELSLDLLREEDWLVGFLVVGLLKGLEGVGEILVLFSGWEK